MEKEYFPILFCSLLSVIRESLVSQIELHNVKRRYIGEKYEMRNKSIVPNTNKVMEQQKVMHRIR